MDQKRSHYYSNPAFCQQSEFYNTNPQHFKHIPTRETPIGAIASSPSKIEYPNQQVEHDERKKHRYEVVEMDQNEIELNNKIISEMKIEEKIISKGRYINSPNENSNRYAVITPHSQNTILVDSDRRIVSNFVPKHRYSEIPYNCEEQRKNVNYVQSSPRRIIKKSSEDVEIAQGRFHRYEMIPADEDNMEEEIEFYETHSRAISPNQVRYVVAAKDHSRYGFLPVAMSEERDQISLPDNRTNYNSISHDTDHNGNSPNKHFVPVPAPRHNVPSRTNEHAQSPGRHQMQNLTSSVSPRKYNPEATQKLHELLSTPRKMPQRTQSTRINSQNVPGVVSRRAMSPPAGKQQRCISPGRHATPTKAKFPQSPPMSPRKYETNAQRMPCQSTPQKNQSVSSPRSEHFTPKAQQKLNYGLPNRFNGSTPTDRSTAIITPMYASRSPNQSVYNETTCSGKSNSWMNLSVQKEPPNRTLGFAALMMILCGALTAGLSFYMISLFGSRTYYLDFAVISGCSCFVLGLLGFRTRNCRWLPNRNFISGYVILSVFSLFTCTALVVLLALRPRPGSALADVTSGAVCGFAALSLLLALIGTLSSYCCRSVPPDNRVSHRAPGIIL